MVFFLSHFGHTLLIPVTQTPVHISPHFHVDYRNTESQTKHFHLNPLSDLLIYKTNSRIDLSTNPQKNWDSTGAINWGGRFIP
jgi:hypothetical protein